MITLGAPGIVVVGVLVIVAVFLAHSVGWVQGWNRRARLADYFERMIRPLERGLGFARARAGWATAEQVEAERKDVMLS